MKRTREHADFVESHQRRRRIVEYIKIIIYISVIGFIFGFMAIHDHFRRQRVNACMTKCQARDFGRENCEWLCRKTSWP